MKIKEENSTDKILPFLYFFLSRAYILVLVILVSALTLTPGSAPGGRVLESWIVLEDVGAALKAVLHSADAVWYAEIAERGYDQVAAPSTAPQNWTFFPLFPLLMRALEPLCGSFFAAGLLLSNLSFLLSLLVLRRYLLDSGFDPGLTRRALWFLCIFPSSYFFSAPLTESLFLLLSTTSFYLLVKNRFLTAGLAYALAGSSRPTALLMLPAFALALHQAGAFSKLRGWAALILAPAGVAAYSLYLWQLTGDPLAFSSNQQAWNRFQHTPLEMLRIFAASPETLMVNWNFLLVNILAAVLGLALACYLASRKYYVWALILVGPLGAALATGSVMSMARFLAALFPTPIALAMLSRKRGAEVAITFILAGLLTAMCLLYGARATAGMA